jgi:hypothetical protein
VRPRRRMRRVCLCPGTRIHRYTMSKKCGSEWSGSEGAVRALRVYS